MSKISPLHMTDPPLTKIRIRADYGNFAWDQEGAGISLRTEFKDIPEIEKIENAFEKWGKDLPDKDEDPCFDWEDFHKRGMDLTHRLNAAIPKDIDIDITYARPFEDPKGKQRNPDISLRQRKKS